jgi:hypothetical protein
VSPISLALQFKGNNPLNAEKFRAGRSNFRDTEKTGERTRMCAAQAHVYACVRARSYSEAAANPPRRNEQGDQRNEHGAPTPKK